MLEKYARLYFLLFNRKQLQYNIRTSSVILKKTCFCLANQEEVSIFNFQNQNNIKRIIKATAIKNIKFSPKQNEF